MKKPNSFSNDSQKISEIISKPSGTPSAFRLPADTSGSASTVPKEGPLHEAAKYASDFFTKSRTETVESAKKEHLVRYIRKQLSTGNLNDKDLLDLRKHKTSDIHRKDIVEALSAFIETQAESLKSLNQVSSGSKSENSINKGLESARSLKEVSDDLEGNKKKWNVFETTSGKRNEALQGLVEIAKSFYNHERLTQYIKEQLSAGNFNAEDLLNLCDQDRGIQRKDIVEALSAFIETQAENLKSLNQVSSGSRSENSIDRNLRLAQLLKEQLVLLEQGEKKWKVFETSSEQSKEALQGLVEIANEFYSDYKEVKLVVSPQEFKTKVINILDTLRKGQGKKYDNEMADCLESIAERAKVNKLSLWASIRIANVWKDEYLTIEGSSSSRNDSMGKDIASSQDADGSPDSQMSRFSIENDDCFVTLMKKASQLIEQWEKEEPVWKAIGETNEYLSKFKKYEDKDKSLLLRGLRETNMIEEQFNSTLEAAKTNIKHAEDYLKMNKRDNEMQKELIDLLDSINNGFKIIDDNMPSKFKEEIHEDRSKESISPKPADKVGDQRNAPSASEKDLSVWNEFKRIDKNQIEREKAKIICLGESHTDDKHPPLFAKLINTFDNAIILFEGIEANVEAKNPECHAMTSFLSGKFQSFGWDNAVLHTIGLFYMVRQCNLIHSIAVGKRDNTKDWDLISTIKNKIIDTAKERNKTLLKALDVTRKQFSDKTIVVIAGADHFTDDMEKELNARQGIILIPSSLDLDQIPNLNEPSPLAPALDQSPNLNEDTAKIGEAIWYYRESQATASLRMMALSNS